MGVIITIAIILFVPICVILTLIILLQDSKGEGLSSSAFGGSEIQSVLGGHGAATFLSKLTTWVAIGFMVISLLLMRFYGETTRDGTLTPLNEETEQSQEAAGTENAVEVEEGTAGEDPKGAITTIGDNDEETPSETPVEDSKGSITPTKETE
ncbi:preprotein translocase subunit SecG [Candidatus Poribacteria bacterium]|nr:preprotein translocase subunit SecG [Candidatus Poribacteria bacterium]